MPASLWAPLSLCVAGPLNVAELGGRLTWWDVSADSLGLASGSTDCLWSWKDPSPQDVTVCQGETVAPGPRWMQRESCCGLKAELKLKGLCWWRHVHVVWTG